MQYDDMVRKGARHFHADHACGTPSLRNTVLRYLLNCIHAGIFVLLFLATFLGFFGSAAVLMLWGIGTVPFDEMDKEDIFYPAFGLLLFYGCLKILDPVRKKIEQLETERDRGGDITQYKREGDMYYYSAADYREAEKWYRRGANAGDTDAQFTLGLMYHKGQGVTKDYVQALKWYNLAASLEIDTEKRAIAVKNCDIMAAKMSPAQIAEAQRLARGWERK